MQKRQLSEAADRYIWDGKSDNKLKSVANMFGRRDKSASQSNERQVPQKQQEFRSRSAQPGKHVTPQFQQSYMQDMQQQISNQYGYETAPYAFQQFSSTEKFAVHPSIKGLFGDFSDLYVDLFGNKQVEFDGSKRNHELANQNVQALKRINANNNKSLPSTVREWAIVNKDYLNESVFLSTLMRLDLTPAMRQEKYDCKYYDFKVNNVTSVWSN